MRKYFFCYSKELANFLVHEKGIEYVTHACAVSTLKKFHLFEYTDELRKALDEFDELRMNKN